MIKNKKGFIRIVEAVFAILLLSGFLLFIYVKQADKSNFGDYNYNTERAILKEVSENESLRQAVLNDNIQTLKSFVASKLPSIFQYSARICQVNDICGLETYPGEKDIYADSVLITSTLQDYNPKLFKLFIWKK